MGERQPYKLDVTGSSPVPPTIKKAAKESERPIKRFNLLIKGTGIRYTVSPKRRWFRDSRQFGFASAAFISILLIAVTGLLDMKSLTSWELFPEKRLDLFVDIPDTPQAKPVNADRKKVVLDKTGVVLSYRGGLSAPVPGAVTEAGNGYLVRFAICLLRENAELIKAELTEKGVDSVIWKVRRKMPAYRLKIGPIPDSITKEKIVAALAELKVSPLAFVDGGYLLTEPVTLQDLALKAREKVEKMSLDAELITEQREAMVFKVTSSPFKDGRLATESLEKWRKMDIDGIVEKMGS